MQFFPCGCDSVFEVYAPERADASPTVTISAGGSTALVSAASMTRDTVSTTISGGVGRGATQVVLASAGDVAAGRYYRIGPLREKVKARNVSTVGGVTTVDLQFPLMHPYAAGVAFVGTRLTYTMLGTTFASPGRDYLARITWLVSTAARTPMDFGFAISRHAPSAPRPFHADVGIADVLEIMPQLPASLSSGTAWEALLSRAEERVQSNIEPHWKAWSLRGQTSQYRECVLMRVLMEAAAQFGQDRKDERKYWADRYAETLDQVLASSNVDNDDDGVVETNEGGNTGIEIVRS